MAKIIIVDDEEYVRRCFMEELIDEGHAVAAISSGSDLLKAIEFLKPDLVVLDVILDDYNGLDLLSQIRRSRYDLPVILCSSYESFKQDPRAMAADYFVIKSYDLTELKDKINRVTEGIFISNYNYQPKTMAQNFI